MNEERFTVETVENILSRYTTALDLAIAALQQSQESSRKYEKLLDENISTIQTSQKSNFISGCAIGAILLFTILLILSYCL